jgi:DNA polymerase elongation subunit (family B)
MIPELRDIIFLDIETVGCTDVYHSLDERLKAQWARKASFLKRDEEATDEDLFTLRAGIYAEFGKVICISVGMLYDTESGELGLKTKSYYGHDEKTVLLELKGMLEKIDSPSVRLCAHNGKEFDFPYLCRRMLVQNIPLPVALNISGRKPWETPHLDTMEMWKFGDYKNYTSLDLLAAIFNIPSSKSDMDGSQVNHVYYKEKNLEKIKNYCVSDVVVLTQLYLKLKGMSLLDPKNVIHSA